MTGGRVRDTLISGLCRLLWLLLHREQAPPSLPPFSRVAVLKPCCLGDLLLATPAINALRRTFPRAHITVATGAWARPAIEGNPDVDEVLDFPLHGSLWRRVRSMRRGRFDVVLVLDRSPALMLTAWLAGIPVRAGLDSDGRGFSLTHSTSTRPLRHEAGLYLDAVRALAPAAPAPGLRFFPGDADRAWAESVLTGDRAWVALHPGGGVNPGSTLVAKRWPAERFAALAIRLSTGGYGVLLVGNGEDAPAAQTIQETAASSSPAGRVLNLSGKTSIGQVGALLARCRLFVGNDTGPMHLAVAMGTPVVAIFGPSSPVAYGPWSARCAVVHHGEHCGGCTFRGGLVAECRNGFTCMAAASEEEVWTAAQRVLRDWAPAGNSGTLC